MAGRAQKGESCERQLELSSLSLSELTFEEAKRGQKREQETKVRLAREQEAETRTHETKYSTRRKDEFEKLKATKSSRQSTLRYDRCNVPAASGAPPGAGMSHFGRAQTTGPAICMSH